MPRKPTPYDKPKKIKPKKIAVPPPVPNAPGHNLVRKPGGSYYWRAKRGTFKKATLNPVLAAMAQHKKLSMAAAARLIAALNPFTCNKIGGYRYDAYKRNTQRFAALFTMSIMKDEKMGWPFFGGIELNPNRSLEHIFSRNHPVVIKNNMATVRFELEDNMVDRDRNKNATHFYFELILIHGDPAKVNSLRSENDISPDYPYMSHTHFSKAGKKQYCELSVVIPERRPYLLILKAATRDGRLHSGAKHEGLRVMGWR